MEALNEALPNYLETVEHQRKPKFKTDKDLLDRKAEKGFRILEECELCERKCRVNRLEDEKGWCKVGNDIRISSFFAHHGEEHFFVPSFTIFFISCNFSCQYCQNWTISQRMESGMKMTEKELAKIIDGYSYCKNVNFVGGEPTPNLPFILKTLSLVNSDIAVVWNSNFYMSEKSMELLKGMVDVYLSDWKYGNNKCAKRLSKVKNYFEVISRNHVMAFGDSEMVIRHLVLPNHFECCTKPILDFIAEHFKKKVIVNILDQYKPQFKAFQYKDISGRASKEKLERIIRYAEELGLNFIT